MTHDQAMNHVRHLGLAVQRCRSIAAENGLGDAAEHLTPWFYGDRCILTAVDKVLANGSVAPSEFYNLMWVANRPENRPLIDVWFIVNGMHPLPEPDLGWYAGWT